ncbi:MAG TPA: DUF58 domain-containing protein [Candidatus Obscuribacterales bacterium]
MVTAVLAFVLYFIASNIGSGWIYLMSASLMTALVASALLPLVQLSQLRVSQSAPAKLVAGQPLTVVLRLFRQASGPVRMPLRLFRLGYEFWPSHDRQALRAQPVLVESLEEEACLRWTTAPLARGVHRLGTVVASSAFPLGLVWWQKRFPARPDQTVTVYPRTLPVDGFFLYRLKTSNVSRGGLTRTNQAARQSTYTRGVREYVRGDSPRHVHWASSARAGRLLVREFEAEGFPNFDVLLDLTANWTGRQQFELAVEAAASLLSLGHRLGIAPQLILKPDLAQASLAIPPVPPGIELQMEVLARVQPVQRTLHGSKDLTEPAAGYGEQKVLVVIRPPRPDVAAGCYFIEVEDTERGPARAAGQEVAERSIDRSRLRSPEDLVSL